jgi:hypothetical protein
MMTRLDEIRALLAEVKRGGVFPSCERADTDMRLLVAEVERTQAALAAERIENAHLREAFVTMERAYNVAEADLAAARAALAGAEAERDAYRTRWNRLAMCVRSRKRSGLRGKEGMTNGRL